MQPPSARKFASACSTASEENGGLPHVAIAFAVNTESIANSWVTLTPVLSSNLGASTNDARRPSPQVAPVEASVKFSSATPRHIRPNSLSAIDAAPQPKAAWNWRRLIPVFMDPPWFGGSECVGLASEHNSCQPAKAGNAGTVA